jgi:hypothetical protein
MLQLAGSVTLMVVVVGSATIWAWRAGLRERFEKRR